MILHHKALRAQLLQQKWMKSMQDINISLINDANVQEKNIKKVKIQF